MVIEPQLACDDESLGEMIAKSDAVGIDAPFGWPTEFSLAVSAWNFNYWNPELREKLCFRKTDRFVYETVLAAERVCGSDRAAGDAHIRAPSSPRSYGSQRQREVLRGVSRREFEPVESD